MVIKKLFNCIDSEKFKKFLNIFTICVIFFYFFISLCAYATWFPGFPRFFRYSTTSGLIVRILVSILFVFCALLNFLSYRDKINKLWFIPFFVILFFGLIFTFFTPTEFRSLYRTTALYDFMGEMITGVSDMTLIKMSLSFLVDMLFGYTFLFIFPQTLKSKKFYLYFALSFVFVMFYSCIYSFVKEKNYYIEFVSGNWKYSPVTIGSIFGDKQQWGIFLAAGVPTSVLICYLASKIYKDKKLIKFLIIGFSILSLVLMLICSLASFCKTAIIANILVVIVLLIGVALHLIIQKKKVLFGVLIFVFLGILLLIPTIFGSVSALKNTKLGSLVNSIVQTLIDRSEQGAGSRFTILFSFLDKFPATNLMFGFNKGVLEAYEYSVTPEIINSLHTGIAIYFGRTGLVGLLIYIIFIIKLLSSICKITRKNVLYGFIFFALFVSSLILNLSELEILITSSSATVFVFNMLLVVLPLSETIECKEVSHEKNISFVSC